MEIVPATKIFIALYAVVILFFAIRGARRTKSMADYAVGKGFSPWVVGLSLAASITSAATFIINPGFVAMFGISAFLAMSVMVPLGLFISLILLTKNFQKYGSSVKALSLASWVGKRFESKVYERIMAVLAMLLITFIVLICVGLVKVLSGALQASELYVLIGLVVFVFGYTMFGGAASMVNTNALQAVIMGVVALILLGSGWEYFTDGIDGFIARLHTIDPMLTKPFNPESPLFRDFYEVVFCNFIIGIAIVCQPHIITRSLMLKSAKNVNTYLWVAILVETLFFMVLFVGLYARLQMPDLMQEGAKLSMDSIMSVYVLNEFTSALSILIIFGLISAGLSTLEGLVQSLSTTITNDIILPLTGSDQASENKKKWINRGVISIMAVVTIFISYQQLVNPNLSVGILGQNGVYLYFSAAFVPVLFGTFLKNVPKAAPMAATITAVTVYIATYYGELSPYMKETVKNPAIAGTQAILASVAVGLIVYYANRKKPVQETA